MAKLLFQSRFSSPTPITALLLSQNFDFESAWNNTRKGNVCLPWPKKMCMEQVMVMTARRKFSVKWWPSSRADMRAVKIVAIVLLNFFRMASPYLRLQMPAQTQRMEYNSL